MKKIYIKNMVCDRCRMVVRQQLEIMGYKVGAVTLGEAEIEPEPSDEDLLKIKERMRSMGFDLLENRKLQLVAKIKGLILTEISKEEWTLKMNLSDYLVKETGLDYHYMSHVFSATEHMTIERFLIVSRIARVKELIGYDELSISEIAWKLGYSSVQALSQQFRKITGITPSEYKKSLRESTKYNLRSTK